MPEKTVVLEVLQPSGVMILGYGSRVKGETFVLPESIAQDLLKSRPDALKLVAPMPMPTPKPIDKELDRG